MADILHIEPSVTNAADAADRINAAIDRANMEITDRRVVLFGDSRTAQCSGPDGWRNMGYYHWLALMTNQSFSCKYDTSLGVYTAQPANGDGTPNPVHDNYGVSGNTTAQMLSRCDKMLAATDAGTFIIFAGINDRPAGITLEQSISNMEGILAKMKAAGKTVILISEMGTGDATYPGQRFSSVNFVRDHVGLQNWLLTLRNRPNVFVVNIWDKMNVLDSTDSSAVDVKAGVTYDGRHPSMQGAYLIAKAMKPTLDRLFPEVVMPANGAADIFDAIRNPTGALNANPRLAGAGGSLGSRVTGAVATGYDVAGGSGSVGASAVASKEVLSDGTPAQRLVISGTPTGAAGVCTFNIQTANLSTKLAPGDIVEGFVKASFDQNSTGILGITIRIEATVDGVNSVIADGAQTLPGNYLPNEKVEGMWRTPEFQIPIGASLTNLRLICRVIMEPNIAAALSLDVQSMALRKV